MHYTLAFCTLLCTLPLCTQVFVPFSSCSHWQLLEGTCLSSLALVLLLHFLSLSLSPFLRCVTCVSRSLSSVSADASHPRFWHPLPFPFLPSCILRISFLSSPPLLFPALFFVFVFVESHTKSPTHETTTASQTLRCVSLNAFAETTLSLWSMESTARPRARVGRVRETVCKRVSPCAELPLLWHCALLPIAFSSSLMDGWDRF